MGWERLNRQKLTLCVGASRKAQTVRHDRLGAVSRWSRRGSRVIGGVMRFDDLTRSSRPHTASIDRDAACVAVRGRNSAAPNVLAFRGGSTASIAVSPRDSPVSPPRCHVVPIALSGMGMLAGCRGWSERGYRVGCRWSRGRGGRGGRAIPLSFLAVIAVRLDLISKTSVHRRVRRVRTLRNSFCSRRFCETGVRVVFRFLVFVRPNQDGKRVCRYSA